MVSDSKLIVSNELHRQEPLIAAATSVCLMYLLGAIVFQSSKLGILQGSSSFSLLVVSQTWNDNEWPKQWHHRHKPLG